MRRVLSLLNVLLLFSLFATAQTDAVRGRVVDEQGNPVPFATVSELGTTNGARANEQGSFIINLVKSPARLAASAVNFETQTQTNVVAGSQVTFTLRRGQDQLSEVIVTAQGQRRTRNQVPYAAQRVNGEEVNRTRNNNFVQNLSGKVSGLEIRQGNTLGGSTNVVIRGVKSLTGTNQALFVVDGVPLDNSTNRSAGQSTGRGGYDFGSAAADINPDDIQDITVLKGAAATALYGSRGGNGVVLITTKKGSRGLGITINSSVTTGTYDKSTFAKYQKEYGGGYGPYYESPDGFFLYRYPNTFAPAYTTDANGNITAWNPNGVLVVPTSEDASYGGRFDASKMVYQWDAFVPQSPYYNKPRPWLPAAHDPSAIFQRAWGSNQSVMVDGGNDRGTFKLGYTRTDDWGILPNSKITKNILNFGGSFNITTNLTAAASVNFNNTTGLGRYGTGYDDKNLMTNFREWWQVNVDLQEQKEAYLRNRENVTWNWADPTDLTPIYWDNPYFTRFENYENDNRNRYFGYASLNYKVSNWLNLLGRVGMDNYNELVQERQAVGSVTVSNYTRSDRSFRETNFDLLANMDHNFSEDFNVKGLLGINIRKSNFTAIASSTNGGLILPRIYALSNSRNPITAPAEADENLQVNGYFAGTTLGYKDYLTLDATIRNDVASTLPENNNSYWYPSVSLGFAFSRLLPTANWLSYGKLRANYAQVGNSTTPYRTQNYYNILSPFGAAALTSVSGTFNNENLLPEKTSSYEAGLEMAFLHNRLGFDVSYYNAKTFNQIYPVPVSTSTGFNSKILNAGNIRNTGVELSLFGTPVKTRNFDWTINVNWTRNRNKVEELAPGIDNIVLGNFQGGVSLNATLGQPYGTIRGQDFTYYQGTNQPIISASSGLPIRSSSSNIVIGNVNPNWIGGVSNRLHYKDISLSWLVDMRQGGDVFSLDLYYGLATGLYPETAGLNDQGKPSRDPVSQGGGVILPGVNPDGKPNQTRASNTAFGLFGYRRQPAAAFVYDASYVKLREAALAYTLPQTLVNRLRAFKGIDLSLVGRNLWMIHKNLPYADPEENLGAGNLQGYQVGAYPMVRTFTFNIKLRF